MHKRTPFGTADRGTDVIWPPYTGPSREPRTHRRAPELWEARPASEPWIGQRVLTDLMPDTRRTDALLILARYLIVRLAVHVDRPPTESFRASIEAAAATDYLDALPGDLPEIRWLNAALETARGRASRPLVARLNAAAAAAGRRGHINGAFALRSAAWEIARRHGWHTEAARVARAIAGAAGEAGGLRSRTLWSRRARVHERRARE